MSLIVSVDKGVMERWRRGLVEPYEKGMMDRLMDLGA